MSELERAAIAWREADRKRLALTGDELLLATRDFLAKEKEVKAAADRAIAAGPGEPSLGELERAVVEGVINLVALDDGFEGLDKEEDYFGNLADRRQQAIDELIELARPLLAARAQATAE